MACKIVADDYGMCAEVNRGISELVKKNVLSKVGVMANESFKYSSSDINNNVKIGLHINLVSNPKIIGINNHKKKASLLKLLYLLYTRQISVNQVFDSVDQQYQLLESKGFEISYLDTHQHVHIVPRILKSIITFAKTRGINSIRCITMEKRYFPYYLYSLVHFGFIKQLPKMLLLYSMGVVMKIVLDKNGISYGRNLVLMPLATGGNYSGLLREFVSKFKDEDAEIVVHPGLEVETITGDGYLGRYIEYLSLLQQERNYSNGKI